MVVPDQPPVSGDRPADPIGTLRSLTADIKRRDQELLRGLATLDQALKDATEGIDVHGASENCTLQESGDDQAIYGYLFFSNGRLSVAYRTPEDDMQDAMLSSDGDPAYRVKAFQDCSVVWLRALAEPNIVQSLVSSLERVMRASVEAASRGVRALETTANLPVRDLESALLDAAKKLDYHKIIDDWRGAQSALGVDPAEAATRACQLLESTCKHILETTGQSTPPKQILTNLMRATTRALVLSPDQQSSEDLRQITSGIFSIANGVGALRTHAGTAHGGSASRYEPTFSEARLAVNSAGVAATFLLEALLARTASR